MNRFPYSNKRDQEPVFDRRFESSGSQSGRCKTISILKGTTDRRSRAQTTPIASLTPKPGEMWTFVFETAGGGTHRQPSWTTLKLNTSRGSQSTQLSELMTLWVFNCRDLLARCNVCTYDAFEETRYRLHTVPFASLARCFGGTTICGKVLDFGVVTQAMGGYPDDESGVGTWMQSMYFTTS
ncbi:hypothetical protein EDB82DRAFT_558160 [Fusarium venenatum]|uniref:uncharacterized protein n=1 Tax=Fusarium venenatum TaxID=56646 RepID=UPI001DDC7D81|nr:hypothetical protein EDB82DRAFT_558160 [Fusarium venenatum]